MVVVVALVVDPVVVALAVVIQVEITMVTIVIGLISASPCAVRRVGGEINGAVSSPCGLYIWIHYVPICIEFGRNRSAIINNAT